MILLQADYIVADTSRCKLYSQTPQYRRSWDWQKAAVFRKQRYWLIGSHIIYNLHNPYLGLGNGLMGGGIGRGGIEIKSSKVVLPLAAVIERNVYLMRDLSFY